MGVRNKDISKNFGFLALLLFFLTSCAGQFAGTGIPQEDVRSTETGDPMHELQVSFGGTEVNDLLACTDLFRGYDENGDLQVTLTFDNDGQAVSFSSDFSVRSNGMIGSLENVTYVEFPIGEGCGLTSPSCESATIVNTNSNGDTSCAAPSNGVVHGMRVTSATSGSNGVKLVLDASEASADLDDISDNLALLRWSEKIQHVPGGGGGLPPAGDFEVPVGGSGPVGRP